MNLYQLVWLNFTPKLEKEIISQRLILLGVLKSLQKVEFSLVGHVDVNERTRFNGAAPGIYWGLAEKDGTLKISKPSDSKVVPFNPLIETDPKLETLLSQEVMQMQICLMGNLGMLLLFYPWTSLSKDGFSR